MSCRLCTPGVLVACAALLVGAPASAGATRVIAPPGNSGVGQYVEVVPTAGGGAPVGSAQHGEGPALPASTVRMLGALGPDGKALVGLVKNTAPRPSSSSHRGASPLGPPVLPPGPSLQATSAAGSVPVLGVGLPVSLGVIALAIAGVAVGRRRRIG
jgi:hypothetical protein